GCPSIDIVTQKQNSSECSAEYHTGTASRKASPARTKQKGEWVVPMSPLAHTARRTLALWGSVGPFVMAGQGQFAVLVAAPRQRLAAIALVVHGMAGAALHADVPRPARPTEQVIAYEGAGRQHCRICGADLRIGRLHRIIVEPHWMMVAEVLVLA